MRAIRSASSEAGSAGRGPDGDGPGARADLLGLERVGHLLEVERIPLRAGYELLAGGRVEQPRRRDVEQLARRPVGDRLERDLLEPVAEVRHGMGAEAPRGRVVLGPGAHRDHDGRPVGQLEQVLEHLAGGDVRLVQALDRDDDRRLVREPQRPVAERRPRSRRQVVGVALAQEVAVVRLRLHREEMADVHERVVGIAVVERGQARPQPRPDDDLALGVVDPEPRPDHLDERLVQADRSVRAAVALEPCHVRAEVLAQLAEQARLADPGLADQEQRLAPSGEQVVGGPAQVRGLGLPADQRRLRVVAAGRLPAQDAPGRHGSRAPLERELAHRLQHEAGHEPLRRRLAGHDRPGSGRRLEPRRDVRHVAERHRLGRGRPDHSDGREAAVDPDADVELVDLPGLADVPAVRSHHLEQREPRFGRAVGVVLVGGRDAEVGAHTVAHVGLHRPAELLDDAAHARDALAHERLDLVGAHALAQPGGADDVGEEGGHRPKLVTPAGPAWLGRFGWL